MEEPAALAGNLRLTWSTQLETEMPPCTIPDPALEAFLDSNADARLESLKALLRIPSISGIPDHAPDCRAAAEFVAADLSAAGAGAR